MTPAAHLDAGRNTADFDAWVAAHWPALVQYAYGVTHHREDALDAVQDALANVLPRWHTLDPDTAERYVWRSIANAAVSSWRKTGRRLLPVAQIGDEPASGPLFDDRFADADQAWRMIETLPPDQRAAVVLRFVEDLDYAAIASVLGCQESTARSHVHRALVALRSRLAPQDSSPDGSQMGGTHA